MRKGGCSYYDRLHDAKGANLLVTNYSYYLAQTIYGENGLKKSEETTPIQLLVCDEAHLAFRALESFMALHLSNQEIQSLGSYFPDTDDWEHWQVWAEKLAVRAESEHKKIQQEIKNLVNSGAKLTGTMLRRSKHYGNLVMRLTSLSTAKGRWIWNKTQGGKGIQFTPVWPGEQSELLFQNTPKILVMSATFTKKDADALHIPEDDREWLEVPSFFPPQNSPIVHVKTARMNHRATQEDLDLWCTRIDQIIAKRRDRKGIVFTVSYDRRNYLMTHSSWVDIMHTHGKDDVYAAVEKFKQATPPAILISPTVTSGWDFPGTECEYVVVGKIPYPDTRDPVTKARCEEDKEWGPYLAMQTLVQECGRGTRSDMDKCEYLIVDSNWQWYWKRYREFAPKWFWQRVNTNWLDMVPEPLI
jgi:Rad3-related DNA helicase